MTQAEWIVSGDAGISSKTMWAALNGVDMSNAVKGGRFDVPYDPADFGRCYRFYTKCNLTRKDLETIREKVKWWAPFIDNWNELERLYQSEYGDRMPNTYDLIQKLEEQSKILGGWVKISEGYWERKGVPNG